MLKRLVFILVCALLVAAMPSLDRLNAQGNTSIGRFSDDFTDNRNGWALGARWGDLAVGGGLLRLSANDPGLAAWAIPDPTIDFPAQVTVSVSVRFIEGLNGQAAILLNVAANGDDPTLRTTFYGVAISSQGEWKIFRRGADANTSGVLQRGQINGFTRRELHTFTAAINGNILYLLLDRVPITVFTDTEAPPSDDNARSSVGLYVGTTQRNSITTVEFSELRITTFGDDDSAISGEGELLFADDFRSDNGDWALGEFDEASATIEDSALVISSTEGYYLWTLPDIVLPNDYSVQTTVEIDYAGTQGSWYYGIGVRYSVFENGSEPFYAFLLTSDQFWGLWKIETQLDDDWVEIREWTGIKTFSPYDQHVIKVVVVGDLYQLYLDGEQIGEVEYEMEEETDGYYMALMAGTFGVPDSMVRVRFTDVEVRVP